VEINLTMEVGAVNDSVTVSAAAPLLDTGSSRAGLNVPRLEVESMPVFADMAILLTRFVSGVNASQIVQYVNQGYASRTSVDYSSVGSIGGSEWTLDGLTNNGYNRQLATSPLGEIVEEMKVETAVFDASFGHSTGISVNQMTRSGVNDPHGSANWQYWNNRWNAANMFQRRNYYTQIDAANGSGNTALAQQLASSPIQAAGFSKCLDLTLAAQSIRSESGRRFLQPPTGGATVYDLRSADRPTGPGAARALHSDAVPREHCSNQQNHQPDVQCLHEVAPTPNTPTPAGVEPFNNLRTQGDPDPDHELDLVQPL
jgi:hypothetical protein